MWRGWPGVLDNRPLRYTLSGLGSMRTFKGILYIIVEKTLTLGVQVG